MDDKLTPQEPQETAPAEQYKVEDFFRDCREIKAIKDAVGVEPVKEVLRAELYGTEQEAQEPRAAGEVIYINTNADPELDPNSESFNPEKYKEAIAQLDMEQISARIQETTSRIMDAVGKTLQSIDFEAMTDRLLQSVNIAFNNADLITTAVQNVIARLQDMTPEEMDALQAEIDAEEAEREAAEREAEAQKPQKAGASQRKRNKVQIIVEEATEDAIKGYMRQGVATNTLTKIKPTDKNTSIDPITGTATIKRGGLTVTIPHFDSLTGLKTSTYQLLDALTVVLTETGTKSPVVSLPLADYMSMRGLKDRKAARAQVEADLETLYNASISFKEKRGKGQEFNFLDVRICDAKGISNGVIKFSFGSVFYSILKGYPVMPIQPQLLKLNAKYNPNSYYLLRRLMEHKNMNIGKGNEDIISVAVLLEAATGLPSYEQVMAEDRALNRRIIQPFERDMDALADTLTWEYCHKNGTPLTDAELAGFDYSTFADALILTHWIEYPDQTKRLEAKQARIEAAEAKKRSGTKKPKSKG